MRTFLAITAFVLTAVVPARTGVYHVAPDGLDTNPGTLVQPFKTITKAVSVSVAGDTILLRGGSYTLTSPVSISKKGNASARYHLFAYPGERPLLDFSSMPVSGSNRGFNFSGHYWHVRGLDVKGAGDNGMNLSGSNNVIEFCSFFENRDTGLQMGGGASNNTVINCDAYYNADPGNGNADGFAAKLDVGTGNTFVGCRAWQNSDDGWDGYLRGANDVRTTYDRCWVFRNGYLKDGSPSSGNGNGFKMGGGDTSNVSNWAHHVTMTRCIAYGNRVKGFDQNNNAGSMVLINCTGYGNGTNYSIIRPLRAADSAVVTNGVSLGIHGSLNGFVRQDHNSWTIPVETTEQDFVSVDAALLTAPRAADGSLPEIGFLRPAQGSDLIDAGIDAGLPFFGAAPDLGAFETEYTSWVRESPSVPAAVTLHQNHPNPFNPVTTIGFSIPERSDVTLSVHDVLGRELAALLREERPAGTHTVQWSGEGNSGGIYFARLRSGAHTQVIRMALVK